MAMSNKILLALQFWEKDRAQAMELARLLADIEPAHSDAADFIFINRFDCPPADSAIIKHVSRKFRVHSYRSPRRGVGWPNGCNELWFGTMEWFYHLAEAKKIPHYKAAFTFEADCVPLSKNWLKTFSTQWDRLNAVSPVYIAGRKLRFENGYEHINGNCFVSGDLKFLHWLVKRVCGAPPNVGWDYCMAPAFRQWGWAEMPGQECYWQTKTINEYALVAEVQRGIMWLHGVKDNSALKHSRKLLV